MTSLPLFDLQATLTRDVFAELVAAPETLYRVELADGPRELAGKWLFFNVVFWRPLLVRGLPITERHLFHNTKLTKEEIARITKAIHDDVVQAFPEQRRSILMELGGPARSGGIINRLFNVITAELGAYHRSISSYELAETLQQPEVAAAVSLDLTTAEKIGIGQIEKAIEDNNKRVLATLARSDIPNNVLYPYIALGVVSPAQLPQVVATGGTRTDVNDQMVLKPIRSSYFLGMADIQEFAIDSLSAKKSIFYNAYGMPNSQYSNRKQQIQASVISRLYPGDCGATALVPFYVHLHNYKHIVGKYIRGADGQLVELTKANAKEFVGQTVHWRSPLTCRHTDGICHVCGGRLTDFMHDNISPGLAAVIELMGPTAQLILSNKHISRTSSTPYRLDPELQRTFKVERNEILLRAAVRRDRLTIGVPFTCMPQVDDLQYIEEEGTINDQHFSRIGRLALADSVTGEILTPEIDMVTNPDDPKAIPYFSAEMLVYIKRRLNTDAVKIGEYIWISLADFDPSLPVLRCVIGNDSMILFAKKVERLFTNAIGGYTSIPKLLQDATNFVYSKPVYPNIMHLEVMLKAALITSPVDFSVPVVSDPHHVLFSTLGHIIPRRSIGAQLAFEKLFTYLTDPSTYTTPRGVTPFDAYVCYSD